MFKYVHNNKGSALALVIIIFAVGMILGTALLRISLAETNFTARQENRMQAHYIARSGAQAVAEYMISDPGDAEFLVGAEESEMNEQVAGGNFSVEVEETEEGNIYVISTGKFNGVSQTVRIRMDRTGPGLGGIFDHAIVAKESVEVGSASGNKIVIEGTLASNGTITMGSKSEYEDAFEYQNIIFPEIIEPPNWDDSVAYDAVIAPSGGDITTPLESDTYLPLYDDIGKSPYYVLVDGDLDLKKRSLNIRDNHTVHIYLKGDLMMETQAEVNIGEGSQLYIYVIGERTVQFSGRGELNHLLIYAPDSHIDWQNAQPNQEFTGALIGKTVKLHNQVTIVYDPELANELALQDRATGLNFTGYFWLDE